jgi:hypothetical protein
MYLASAIMKTRALVSQNSMQGSIQIGLMKLARAQKNTVTCAIVVIQLE